MLMMTGSTAHVKDPVIEIRYLHLLANLSHYVVNYAALCGKHKATTPGQVAGLHNICQRRKARPLDY